MADIQQKTTDAIPITHPDNPQPIQQHNIKGQQGTVQKQNAQNEEGKQNNQQNVEVLTSNENLIHSEKKINQNTEEVQPNDKKSQEMKQPQQQLKPQQQVQIAVELAKQQILQQSNQIKNQEPASLPQVLLQQDLSKQANQNISNNQAQAVAEQKIQEKEEALNQQQQLQVKTEEKQLKIQQNVPHQNQPIINASQAKQQKQQIQLPQDDKKQQLPIDIIATQTNTNQYKIQNNGQIQSKDQRQQDKFEPVNSQLVFQKQQQQKILLNQQTPQVPMIYRQSEIHINLTEKLQQNIQLAPSNAQIQGQKSIQVNKKQQKQMEKPFQQTRQKQQKQVEKLSSQIRQKQQKQVDKPSSQVGQKQIEKSSSQTQKVQLKQIQKKDEANKKEQKNQGTTGIDMKYFQTKIDQSLIWKQKGTQMFKAKIYDKAIQFYTEGMKQIDPSSFYGATKQQCQRMAQIAGTLLYNIGCCYFNLKKYQQSETFYNEALTINHKYTKAFYKRAMSRYQQNKLEGALNDIKSAYALQKSSQIHDSYALIAKAYNQQINRSKQAQKALTSKMFGNEKKKDKSQQQEVIQKKTQFNQPSEGQENNWIVPMLIGVTVLGFFAYRFFKK